MRRGGKLVVVGRQESFGMIQSVDLGLIQMKNLLCRMRGYGYVRKV